MLAISGLGPGTDADSKLIVSYVVGDRSGTSRNRAYG